MNKKYLGVAFSILITITYGFIFNAVQANTITVAFQHAYGINQFYGAIILTVLTAIIILEELIELQKFQRLSFQLWVYFI